MGLNWMKKLGKAFSKFTATKSVQQESKVQAEIKQETEGREPDGIRKERFGSNRTRPSKGLLHFDNKKQFEARQKAKRSHAARKKQQSIARADKATW